MATTTKKHSGTVRFPAGQRLQCQSCGAEIEIIQPCGCNPPDQVFQCCGEDMTPTTGQNVHVNAE